MALLSGKTMLIKVGDGGGPEVFTTVGRLRGTGVTIQPVEIDVSSKDTATGWLATETTGDKRLEVSFDGLLDTSSAALTRLISIANGTQQANFRLSMGNGKRYSFAGVLTSWQVNGPHDNKTQYTGTVKNAADPVYEDDI